MSSDRHGMPTLSSLIVLIYIGAAFGAIGAITLWDVVRHPINHMIPSNLCPFFFGRRPRL